AQGRIIDFIYDNDRNESYLTFDSITYKPFSQWDAEKLTAKNIMGRSTTIYPDTANMKMSFSIVNVDEALHTITVQGDATNVWIYNSPPSDFGIIYGQLIRQSIKTYTDPNDSDSYIADAPVKFFDNEGTSSFVREDRNGICQVCHTLTRHYTSDGIGDMPHDKRPQDNPGPMDDMTCTDCHLHSRGFSQPGSMPGSMPETRGRRR
ncbi:hypothetical protein ACFL6N_01740, partial [Thermodesulfobacteriota bacterium]